jgi:cytochrome b6-f complex subunit 4
MVTIKEPDIRQRELQTQPIEKRRDCYKSKSEWRNELFYVFPVISLATLAICVGFAVLNPVVNGEPADPFATPQDLLPEWYLYPVYQLVRVFPNKVLGIIIMGLTAAGLLLIPFIENIDLVNYRCRRVASVTIFLTSFVVMLWLGIGATFPVDKAFTLRVF